MALKAFIDDSGKSAVDGSIYLLAGYIARAESWAAFSDEWLAAMAQEPAIANLHMTEAASLNGEFHRWSPEDRDRKLILLAMVIKKHVMGCFFSSVLHVDYDSTVKGKINKFMDRAYMMLAYYAIGAAYAWTKENGIDEKIDFVFDEQKGDSDKIQGNWTKFMEIASDSIKNMLQSRPVHQDDKLTPPLQAADMLAWHLHKDYASAEKGRTYNSVAYSILLSIPHKEYRLTKKRLANWIRGLEKKTAEAGQIFPHQIQYVINNIEGLTTKRNRESLQAAKEGETVSLFGIPATEVKRFQLVNKCPSFDSHHLHRKFPDECLGV